MKTNRLVLYPLAALFFLVASCSKDDDNPSNSQLILGQWSLVKEVELYYDEDAGVFNDSSVYEIDPGVFLNEFKSDGNLYQTNYSSTPMERDTFNYSVVNDVILRLSIPGDDSYDYKIAAVSSNELHIFENYRDGSDSVEYHIYFTK